MRFALRDRSRGKRDTGPRPRRRTLWLRGSAALALLLVVAAGSWLAVATAGEDGGEWVEAVRDDLVIEVEVTGTLRAVDSGVLGPPQIAEMWDFKISQMAPEGEEVRAGDVVLEFDTSELEQMLRERSAESQEARKQIEKNRKELRLARRKDELRLAEARAKLRKAQLKVDVPPELEKGKDLELARLDLRLAEAEIAYLEGRIEASRRATEAALAALRNQLEHAESQVAAIRRSIGQMSVKAPRDGTVVYATNWRDEKKKVGDSCWRGEKVVELPDLREMTAGGEVQEADAGRVAEDQPVRLRLEAHRDVEFRGKVRSIRRTVQRQSWRTPLKVVKLDIALEDTDTQRMRPGMRFRGHVETERVAGALLVPIEAVFTSADGPVVYRKGWFGARAVNVELGRRDGSRVEVVGGLREGESISLRDLALRQERA